jgi:hypothetical protein
MILRSRERYDNLLMASYCHLFNLPFFSNFIYLNMAHRSLFSCQVVAATFFIIVLWSLSIFSLGSFLISLFLNDLLGTTPSLVQGVARLD